MQIYGEKLRFLWHAFGGGQVFTGTFLEEINEDLSEPEISEAKGRVQDSIENNCHFDINIYISYVEYKDIRRYIC